MYPFKFSPEKHAICNLNEKLNNQPYAFYRWCIYNIDQKGYGANQPYIDPMVWQTWEVTSNFLFLNAIRKGFKKKKLGCCSAS